MKYLVYGIILLNLVFACKKNPEATPKNTSIKSGTATILNQNSLTVIDLNNFNVIDTIQLKVENNIFANQLILDSSKTHFLMALPQFDFSLDHSILHTTSPKGGIGLFNISKENFTQTIDVPFANYNTSQLKQELWTAESSHSGKVNIYNMENGLKTASILVDADPKSVLIKNKGKLAVLVAGEGSFLITIDTDLKKVGKEIKIDPFPSNVRDGFDDSSVFVENQNRKSLNIIDLNLLTVTEFLDFDFQPAYSIYNNAKDEIWIAALDKRIIAIYTKNNGKWVQKEQINADLGIVDIDFFKDFAIITNQLKSEIQVV